MQKKKKEKNMEVFVEMFKKYISGTLMVTWILSEIKWHKT